MLQLKEILKNNNITQLDIANKLGIRSLSTINQKLNNKSEFTVREAIILRNWINESSNKRFSIEELFDDSEEQSISINY